MGDTHFDVVREMLSAPSLYPGPPRLGMAGTGCFATL